MPSIPHATVTHVQLLKHAAYVLILGLLNSGSVCCIVCLGTEWVDPEDPTVIAETELLGAAASIEAAAKKLEQLKPRAKPRVMHMLNALFKDYSTLVCCKGTVLLIYIIYICNKQNTGQKIRVIQIFWKKSLLTKAGFMISGMIS